VPNTEEPVNVIPDVAALLHTVWLLTALTVGVGLTVIVNICGVPKQPFALGVTVTEAITGLLLELVAINDPILPVPVAASPIEVVLFDQLNVVPETAPVNTTADVAAPLHTVWFAGDVTVGVGLTVYEYVVAMPEHPLATGVTVILAITGVVPPLFAVNEPILPTPLAARPTDVLSFVQL
jgi:hypothetical protein